MCVVVSINPSSIHSRNDMWNSLEIFLRQRISLIPMYITDFQMIRNPYITNRFPVNNGHRKTNNILPGGGLPIRVESVFEIEIDSNIAKTSEIIRLLCPDNPVVHL